MDLHKISIFPQSREKTCLSYSCLFFQDSLLSIPNWGHWKGPLRQDTTCQPRGEKEKVPRSSKRNYEGNKTIQEGFSHLRENFNHYSHQIIHRLALGPKGMLPRTRFVFDSPSEGQERALCLSRRRNQPLTANTLYREPGCNDPPCTPPGEGHSAPPAPAPLPTALPPFHCFREPASPGADVCPHKT